ncbi:MAG: hypothetical protein K0T99_00940 [Alphaproteobacteria bacterium]|nr:hypothetical protein [Alphaproteobacteria bacterium]
MTVHFWEFICFLIFVALIFRPTKNFILSYLNNYSYSIEKNLSGSRKIKEEALENVEHYSQKHEEFKNIVKDIKSNTEYSIKKLKEDAEKEITEKISLKNAMHETNLEIQKAEHISKIKSQISSQALSIVRQYLKDHSSEISTKNLLKETLETLEF